MTDNRDPRVALLAEARAYAQAADAIVGTSTAPALTATDALLRSWSALARARTSAADGSATRLMDALRWLPETLRGQHEGRVRDLGERPRELTDPDVLVLTRGAFEVLKCAEQDVLGRAVDVTSRRRLAMAATIGLASVAATAWGLAASSSSVREGPWIATYYDTPSFDTPALVVREGDVRFEWAEGPARPDGPRDNFAVRFESCLHTEGSPVTFQLVSNDASSLFVDGKMVVENAGEHRERSRGRELDLAAGVHRVRVDYREYGGRAMVALVASFDDRRPRSIDTVRLTLPAPDGSCPP